MFLEGPEGMALRDAEGFGAVGHLGPLSNDDPQITGGAEEWHTVGHLYRGIERGLAHLVDRYGESDVFIGPPKAQATTQTFEWPELTAVTNSATASSALEIIYDQAESARADSVEWRFGRIVAI